MDLKEALNMILNEDDCEKKIESERRFTEILTFSNSVEIFDMLNQVLSDDWMILPVWIRNLSFRLICLQEPNNPEIRKRAAADLRCFGPDWDSEADRLEREAAEIEQVMNR